MALAALAGCKSHEAGRLSAADVAEAFEARRCEFSLRCGTYPISGLHYSCHPAVVARRVQWHRDNPRLIDQERAEACLASLEADPCRDRRPECDGLLQGDRGEGEPCEVFYECAPGLFCTGAADGCSGTCVPQRGEGEPCGEFGACASGGCTHPDADTAICWGTVAVGEPCEPGRSCEGGYCDADGICQLEDAAAGAACAEDWECPYLYRCAAGVCALADVQRPGEGDVCRTDEECQEAFGCQDGACVRYPVEGEACGDVPCLWSGCIDGVCAPVPAGGSCMFDADCAGWWEWSRPEGVCQAPTPIGGACRRDAQCGESGWCADGVCAVKGMCE